MVNIPTQPLTIVETYSITENLTQTVSEWNHSIKHPSAGPIAARLMGCCGVAFTALADVFIHVALTLGKLSLSLVVMPFKCCVRLPKDLELSSSLIHLMKVIQSVFYLVILPPLCLINPDRAYFISKNQNAKNREIEQLRQKENQLHIQIGQEENKLNALKVQIVKKEEVVPVVNPINPGNGHVENLRELISITKNDVIKLTSEIENLKIAIQEGEQKKYPANQAERIVALKDQKKKLQDQIEECKRKVPADQLLAAEQEVQQEQRNRIHPFNLQIEILERKIVGINKQIATTEKNKESVNESLQSLKDQLAQLEIDKTALDQKILLQENELASLINNQNEPVLLEQPLPDPKMLFPKLNEKKKEEIKAHAPPEREENNFIEQLPILLQNKAKSILDDLAKDIKEDQHWDYFKNDQSEIDRLKSLTETGLQTLKLFNAKFKCKFPKEPKHLNKKQISAIEILLKSKKEGLSVFKSHIHFILEFCKMCQEDEKIKKLEHFIDFTDPVNLERSIIANYSLHEASELKALKHCLEHTLEYFDQYLAHLRKRLHADLDWE